ARSHQSLEALTGQRIAFVADGRPTERAAAARIWQQWIESSGSTASLVLPLTDQVVPLGRTLLVAGGQKLVELDAASKQLWELQLPGAAWGCQGLPNGHRLVAVYA